MASSFGNDSLNNDKPLKIHIGSEGELHNKYILLITMHGHQQKQGVKNKVGL